MAEPSRTPRADLAQRDQLIDEYAPVVRYLAQRLAFRLPPYLDIEDLIHAGIIGLMDAIGKYNPAKETKFKTYAEFRIRGAMLDELRSLDWIPRSVREKIGLLQKTFGGLEKKLGRPPTGEEAASAMEMSQEQFDHFMFQAKASTLLSLEDFGFKEGEERNIFEALADARAEDPLISLLSQDVREKLVKAIKQLPKKEQLVISLYYDEELTMKEIGQTLNITESRVCQLHSQAILRLKGKLKTVGDRGK